MTFLIIFFETIKTTFIPVKNLKTVNFGNSQEITLITGLQLKYTWRNIFSEISKMDTQSLLEPFDTKKKSN